MPADTVSTPSPQENPAAIADGWADGFTPETHVYEPHRVGLPPLRPYVRELWRRREFAIELARTKLEAQHYGTVFGLVWLILNPLMLGVVYFILVSIIRTGDRPEGFFAHLLGGIFAYYLVSDAIRPASRSVVSGGRLILNTAFPRALLPLSALLTSIMRFLPMIPVYVAIHTAIGRPIDWAALWALPILASMLVFAAGACMLVAALQVYFRDMANFLPYLLRVWLYLSPILWYAHEVPNNLDWLLYVNPLAPMLGGLDDALNAGVTPDASWLLAGLAWALGTFVVGALFFVSREREFAVRL
jgi:teichoic acid transport system permease protein